MVEFVIGDTGCIEYAVVYDGRRWAAIPWTAATFDIDSRTLRIDIHAESPRRDAHVCEHENVQG